MVTPQQLRQAMNQSPIMNAYDELKQKYILSRHETPDLKVMPCMSEANNDYTVRLIKKALKGDPRQNQNIIIGECVFFDSEHELGKEEKFFVKGIAKCAELKRKFLSSSLEGIITIFVTYPKDFEYFLKERRSFGMPEAMGLSMEIPVKYILNAPISAYLD